MVSAASLCPGWVSSDYRGGSSEDGVADLDSKVCASSAVVVEACSDVTTSADNLVVDDVHNMEQPIFAGTLAECIEYCACHHTCEAFSRGIDVSDSDVSNCMMKVHMPASEGELVALSGWKTVSNFEGCCDMSVNDHSECTADGVFTEVECSPNGCRGYEVEFSAEYAAAGSIQGTMDGSVHVDCLAGYTTGDGPSAGVYPVAKSTRCNADESWDEVVCTPIPCFDYRVANSDKSAAASITGVTTDTADVLCDSGYSGSATTTCEPGSRFSSVECRANPCVPYQIQFSNMASASAITGVTGNVVSFRCDRGWSAAVAGTFFTVHDWRTTCQAGCRDCDGDGQFTRQRCDPNPCIQTSVPHSDHAPRPQDSCPAGTTRRNHQYANADGSPNCQCVENGDACESGMGSRGANCIVDRRCDSGPIEGVTTESTTVTCDAGYSKYGEWGSPSKADITDRHIIAQQITCNPTDESPGFFDTATCLPNPCDPISVAHSNKQDTSIRGNTDDTVNVECHSGYEIFDGGEGGRTSAATLCQTNGTFTWVACAPVSRVGVVMRNARDTPRITGTDGAGNAIWSYSMGTVNVDYFSDPLLSALAATESYVSTMFKITSDTISFMTSGGSAAAGSIVISLYTDFEGSYLAAKDSDRLGGSHSMVAFQGTKRLSHEPVPGGRYPVTWEVAGLLGRKAAITVVDNDPSGVVSFDDLRMYHTETGCLPECLMIRHAPCLAQYAVQEAGMTCLYFNGNNQPYVPQKKAAHGLVQFCQYGLGPFGENGQASLRSGWPEGISHERLEMFNHLPVCVFVQIIGPTTFGFALSPEDPIFVLDSRNTESSASDQLHCLYETTKPRCASFAGTLKERTQHNLFCVEIDPEPSCMEIVMDKKCGIAGKFCGANENSEPDKKTLDLLECCNSADNGNGKMCLESASRRLTEAVESVRHDDVDSAAACAEVCLRHANGPMGGGDACVAWRLNKAGKCKIATDCMFSARADVLLVAKQHWNTFESVDMFKGQARPGPVLVRKRNSPSPSPSPVLADLALCQSAAEWSLSVGDMLERTCPSCGAQHQTIVYKRLTDPGTIDFRKLMLQDWFNSPPGGSNVLNTDFALFSSRDDAAADTNPWAFCNYNDGGVGFPRDCGVSSFVGGQWNSDCCPDMSGCTDRGGQEATWKIVS